MITKRSVLLLIIIVLALSPNAPSNSPTNINESQYRIKTQMPLTANDNKIVGELLLLVDKNLPEQYDPLSEQNLENAVIKVGANDGRCITMVPLERPAASLEECKEIPANPIWYALTVDYSAGFGSYSGPVTSFIRVYNGKLQWLAARNQGNRKDERISLMKSLKTYWIYYHNAKRKRLEIRTASCRPVFKGGSSDEPDFRISYGLYYQKKGSWYFKEKSEPGFWEAESEDLLLTNSKYAF